MVAGLVVAATGVAPDHWMAHLVQALHVPADVLHLWAAQIDLRWALLVSGLILVAGDIAWRRSRLPAAAVTATLETEALPLPDRPSIAVLPFANLSGDPEQEYFSDGVADDVITHLSRNHSLFVIARNSSFTYRDRAVDVKRVARELGVRYVVEGSVRREANHVRINAQLIYADTGYHLWAEQFDRDMKEVFALQDEIAHSIVAAIDPAISQAERRRALQQPSESLGAWEAYQQAMWYWSKADELATPRQFLHRAVELNPRFAAARAMLGWRYLTESSMGTDLPLTESVRLAEGEARKALELEPDNATAHATLAWVFFYQGDSAAALEEADGALMLNLSDAQAHLIKGRILVFAGRTTEGRTSLAAALRLDPHGPTGPPMMVHNAINYYFEGNYLAAESMARRAIRAYPNHPIAYRWLAATLGQLGRTQEGRAILNKITRNWPESFAFYVGARPPGSSLRTTNICWRVSARRDGKAEFLLERPSQRRIHCVRQPGSRRAFSFSPVRRPIPTQRHRSFIRSAMTTFQPRRS